MHVGSGAGGRGGEPVQPVECSQVPVTVDADEPRADERRVPSEAGLDGVRRHAKERRERRTLDVEGRHEPRRRAEHVVDHRLDDGLRLVAEDELEEVDVRPREARRPPEAAEPLRGPVRTRLPRGRVLLAQGRLERAPVAPGQPLVAPALPRDRPNRRWPLPPPERHPVLAVGDPSVAQHYDIELDSDPSAERATAVRFTRRPVEGSMMTHPGVYCLRSNQTDWDEGTLWRTYVTLTDLEAVFRSLKSELGLRPIFHHKPIRAEGHLFITVIAYQLVQLIRRRLREAGEHASWNTVRRILEGQQRITATFRRADGRTLHVRKATCAEPPQHAIYDALGIDPAPGETHKTIV